MKVWEIKPIPPPCVYCAGTRAESGVTFGRDGQSLISCGADGSVRAWSLQRETPGEAKWTLPDGSLQPALLSNSLVIEEPPLTFKVWDLSKIPETLEPGLCPHRRCSATRSNTARWHEFFPGRSQSCGFPRGMGNFDELYGGSDEPKRVEAFPQFGVLGPNGVYYSKDRLFVHGRARGEPHLLVWDLSKKRAMYLGKSTLRFASAMAVVPDQSRVFVGDEKEGALDCTEIATGHSTVWTNAFVGTY